MTRRSVADRREDAERAKRALTDPGMYGLGPDSVIYLSVASAARSGLSRKIACSVIMPHHDQYHVGYRVGPNGDVGPYPTATIVRCDDVIARALGLPYDRTGVRMAGAGYDVGLWLVGRLAHVLGFPLRYKWID